MSAQRCILVWGIASVFAHGFVRGFAPAPTHAHTYGHARTRVHLNLRMTTMPQPQPLRGPTKIVDMISVDDILSIRLKQVVLSTQELALTVMQHVREGRDIGEIASTLSLHEASREGNGEVGWVDLNTPEDVIPRAVVQQSFHLQKGDMKLVAAGDKFYVVQVMDVMTKMSPVVKRRRAAALRDGRMPESLFYNIETMGCQMNSADSEKIAGQLEELGYKSTDNKDTANVVILNTCSIRDHSEQKVYSHVGRHAFRKRMGEDVTIVVAGCVAQQEGEKLLRRVPEVDLVMGPQYANRIASLLEDVNNGNQVVATDPIHIIEDVSRPRRESSVCGWVNIIYGCNERCTYCVVPFTRGVEQSRTREAIRDEMMELAKNGYREITLLGQNIDAWGRDMEPRQRFSDLLRYVADVPGIERVRFVTSHPRYMSQRVVDAVADHPNLMECFHIPFQSGDDVILRRMRRGHTRAQYLEVVRRIREAIPDASITADVIVGFPGETDEQFRNTLDLMEQVKFDVVNTAAYSPRPNTPAADWPDQISEDVKMARLYEINRLGSKHALERSERYVGRLEDVLVEDVNTKHTSQVFGRTRTNRLAFFDGDITQLKGKIVPVRIIKALAYSLTGEQAGDPR